MEDDDVRTTPAGSADVAAFGDADLVLRTRSGDPAAFGELWRRHYRSGVTVARSVSSSLDPDDLVQEAYTRIYQSIVSGGGPTGSFRAYLFTSIRNTAASWGRARRETTIDALDTIEDPTTSETATSEALDRSLTHQAFRSLPSRWQEVLWYSEIEQMKPAEIAPLLGMKATAVAQLTFRAREGLREAWIQAHLQAVVDGSDCQWTIEHLGAYSRANLSRRDRGKVQLHLVHCARCAIVASEAKEVSSRLALVLLPLTVGAVGTAGYLATIQGGGTALVTLAAMPSSVMQGAVTVMPGMHGIASAALGAGATGAAGGTAGAAAAGAGGAAAGSAAAGGGILSGVGAMTGLTAASLVVASTVVAAAVLLPGLTPTSALDDRTPSVVQQTAPSSSLAATDDTVEKVDPAAETVVDKTATDGPFEASNDVSVGPGPQAAAPVTPDTTGESTPPEQQATTTEPEQTTTEPEQAAPAPPNQSGPVRGLPAGTPSVAGSSSSVDPATNQTTIQLVLGGAPDATVQVRIRGDMRAVGVIGDDGTVTLSVPVSAQEIRVDSRVELRYVNDQHMSQPASARISELL